MVHVEKRSIAWITNFNLWVVSIEFCKGVVLGLRRKSRRNDDMCIFKKLTRLRIETSGSSRTDRFSFSMFSIVLEDFGRPDFFFFLDKFYFIILIPKCSKILEIIIHRISMRTCVTLNVRCYF